MTTKLNSTNRIETIGTQLTNSLENSTSLTEHYKTLKEQNHTQQNHKIFNKSQDVKTGFTSKDVKEAEMKSLPQLTLKAKTSAIFTNNQRVDVKIINQT